MSGYTDTYTKTTDDTIEAADFETEYNKLGEAFVVATGHKHDGTIAEGAYVPLISDVANENKVVVDSGTSQIDFYIDVSGAVKQMHIEDGLVLPEVDDDVSLGSATYSFKDVWADGTSTLATLASTTATISNLTVTGTIALPDDSIQAGDIGAGALPSDVTINNDNWSGTDLSVTNGGTGASTATGAASNLGLGQEDNPRFSGVQINAEAPALTITDTTTGAITNISGNTVGGGFIMNADSTSVGSDPYIGLSVQSVEKVRVTSAGRVGIGITNPNGALHISGGRYYHNANNEKYAMLLSYGSSNDGMWLGSPATDSLSISASGGTERVRINSSGNVGIGTSNPTEMLHVAGNLRVGSSIFHGISTGNFLNMERDSANYIRVGSTAVNGSLIIAGRNSGTNYAEFYDDHINLLSGGVVRLYISNNYSAITNSLRLDDVPTSSTGLSAGFVWRDGNTLKIV